MRTVKIPRPVNDQLIVEILKPPTETPGGIQLPDTAVAEGEVCRARVLAAGPGRVCEYEPIDQGTGGVYLMPMNAKTGDVVILGVKINKRENTREIAGAKSFKDDDGRKLAMVQDQFVLAIEDAASEPVVIRKQK
jgi:co-chaperonin GroES (HSP10)